MVAAEEGYDVLARHHIDRVQRGDLVPWLSGARFLLACRAEDGSPGLEPLAEEAGRHVSDRATLERWMRSALRHSRHAVARRLLDAADPAVVSQGDASLLAWRRRLQALDDALHRPVVMAPVNMTWVAMPPFVHLLDHSADDWVPPSWRRIQPVGRMQAAGVTRWWSRLLRRGQRGGPRLQQSIGLEPLDATRVARMTPETVSRFGVMVVPDGRLDATSASHWLSVLVTAPAVVVLGLRVDDPDVMRPDMVVALRRHEPIGTATEEDALLLAEFGIQAYRSGVLSGQSASEAEAALRSLLDLVASTAGHGEPTELAAAAAAWRAACWHACRAPTSLSDALPDWSPPRDVAWNHWVAAIGASRVELCDTTGDLSQAIHLAMCVDEHLANVLPVVVESALESASRPLWLHVLGRSISACVQADWRKLFHGRARIELFDCGAADFVAPTLLKHTTVSTLDRLLLPALLDRVPRVVYLDVDLIVRDDLAKLWATDLQGQPLAARPSGSPGTRWGTQMLLQAVSKLPKERARAARRWLFRSGVMGFRAFNAGVLVMDLERMRADSAVDLTVALVFHCAMNDQDALNTYARGGYVALNVRWNSAPRQDPLEGAAIVHFVGPVKPWGDVPVRGASEFRRVRAQLARRLAS